MVNTNIVKSHLPTCLRQQTQWDQSFRFSGLTSLIQKHMGKMTNPKNTHVHTKYATHHYFNVIDVLPY